MSLSDFTFRFKAYRNFLVELIFSEIAQFIEFWTNNVYSDGKPKTNQIVLNEFGL